MDEFRFRHFRNQVIRVILLAKQSHYLTKIHHLKQINSSKWYGKIRNLCWLQGGSHHQLCLQHIQSRSQLNTYFSICQSLPKLDRTRLPAYLPSPEPPPTIKPHVVAKKLISLRCNRAITLVDLPVKLYNEIVFVFATPFYYIINVSLKQSQCLAAWKMAYVTAIPMCPSTQTHNDLKPVVITPLP